MDFEQTATNARQSSAGAANEMQRALAWLAGGATLLDVRTAQEFAGGHARGAVNIPVQELAQRSGELGSDFKQPFVLYCRSGARSAMAAKMLRGLGFELIVDVGSLSALLEAQ